MRKATYTAVLMLAITGAFLAGYVYNQRGGVKAAGPSGARILRYACPMHPQHASDRPGECPACGMQLVARSEDNSAGNAARPDRDLPPGVVKVSADKQQIMGVTVSPVERRAGTRALRLFGRVAPDETRVYRLNAGVDGFIRQVSAVTTGSQVLKGQWLATFSAPDVRQPIQAYLVALNVLDRAAESGPQTPAQTAAATASIELAADRLQNLGMSRQQIDEIARTRELATALRILAPADGFVLVRNVSAGQKFDRDTEWFRIADLRKVWILADVFGADADDIRAGAAARVLLPDRRRSFPARVSEVLPQIDPETRTLRVRFEVDNPECVLRPDMPVDVELSISFPPTIAVPTEAVLDSGLRKTVFVDRGGGVFEPRRVRTGWRFDDRVEIVDGLEPGERVVTSGTFLIDSDSRMKLALARPHAAAPRDPICAMEVDEREATAAGRTSTYGGRTYVFCSPDCKHQFDAAPGRHADTAARAGDQVGSDMPAGWRK